MSWLNYAYGDRNSRYIFISHEAAKHTTKSTNTTHNNKSQTVKIKKN